MAKVNMKITFRLGLEKVRKRMPPKGGAMTTKKGGKGYNREKIRRADWD